MLCSVGKAVSLNCLIDSCSRFYGAEGPGALVGDGLARLERRDHRLQILTVEGVGRLGGRKRDTCEKVTSP